MTRLRNRSGPLCSLFFRCFLQSISQTTPVMECQYKKQSECMETETFRGKKAREGKKMDNVTQARYRIPSNIDQFPLDLQQPRLQQRQVSNEAREGGRDSWKIRVGLSKKPLDIAARLGCIWNA